VLELYQVHAVTEGTDAQAEVSVRLSEQGRAVTAKGADPTRSWPPPPRTTLFSGFYWREEGESDSRLA
jgi:LeuA allosteric (dimerisation) domain